MNAMEVVETEEAFALGAAAAHAVEEGGELDLDAPETMAATVPTAALKVNS